MQVKKNRENDWTKITMWIGTAVTVAFILIYAYYIHQGKIKELSHIIHRMGLLGIVMAILILAVLCVLPVPSEFVIIMNMEVYGAVQGIFYSWIGGIVGAIMAVYVTRWMARPLVERLGHKYIDDVNTWVNERGSVGFLALRFVPFIPYHLVNYACGVLRVNLWTFTWTTALGILPFDLGMAGVFSGLRHGTLNWGIGGVLIFIVLMLAGWLSRRKWLPQRGRSEG